MRVESARVEPENSDTGLASQSPSSLVDSSAPPKVPSPKVLPPKVPSPKVPPDTSTNISTDLRAQAAGVSLRGVTKRYGKVTAIKDLNLDIPAGSYCCLLGPSGCGKTTALRVIAGHEVASEGAVLIGDQPVTHLPPAKRNTAMMFQSYALFPHKTVWQNVEFGLKMKGVSAKERRDRTAEILDLVGLANTAQRKPDALSGGQQQRIALARALVTRPAVLMLDEPLSALDENLRVRMRSELRRIQRQFGLTFIQVTHHVEEAFSLSDQIVVMSEGHIEQVATPTELFNTPVSQFVAKFIGDNNIFSGRVVSAKPTESEKTLIEISVDGVGALFCQGNAASIGAEAACSVRPDLLVISLEDKENQGNQKNQTASSMPENGTQSNGRIGQPHSLSNHLPNNSLNVRIVEAELTGYVTRVTLVHEPTQQRLLYKARTTDWVGLGLAEGQEITVCWSAKDCVFLPY